MGGRAKVRRSPWDAELRALSGNTPEPHTPKHLRKCRLCRHALGLRLDRDDVPITCALDRAAMAAQVGLFLGLSPLPQYDATTHSCENWGRAQDD